MATGHHELDRAQLAARLGGFARRGIERPGHRRSAVAVVVLPDEQGRACVVITRRAATLRAHAAQWALPGGRIDGAETAIEAAVRETGEEIALQVNPRDGDVLGVLDDYATRSGYVITPVVVWGGDSPVDLVANEAEVASIHLIPVADLDVEPELVSIPESPAPVIRLPLLGRHVHAPTAAILYQFCQVGLRGLDTRVDHFEAPVFAWR